MAYRLFMRSASPLAALTLAAALLLSGCVPQVPAVVPPPEQTTEPVFASDEEALAAATDAYTAYLAMSDLIAQEGGANPERIAPFVTEEWLKKEIQGNRDLVASGRKLVGGVEVRSTSVQQVFGDTVTPVTVVIYACLNPNGARLLDASGADVTPELFSSAWTTEATLVSTSDAKSHLLVAKDEPWSDTSVCS